MVYLVGLQLWAIIMRRFVADIGHGMRYNCNVAGWHVLSAQTHIPEV